MARSVGSRSEPLAALLSGWSVQERIDAGKAIEDIEDHPGVQVLLKLVQEAREVAFFRLTHGSTEAVGKLNKDLGFVNGLEVLPDALVTIREKAQEAQRVRDDAAKHADEERQAQTT